MNYDLDGQERLIYETERILWFIQIYKLCLVFWWIYSDKSDKDIGKKHIAEKENSIEIDRMDYAMCNNNSEDTLEMNLKGIAEIDTMNATTVVSIPCRCIRK